MSVDRARSTWRAGRERQRPRTGDGTGRERGEQGEEHRRQWDAAGHQAAVNRGPAGVAYNSAAIARLVGHGHPGSLRHHRHRWGRHSTQTRQ